MLPFSLCNKKRLAIWHTNRPPFPKTLPIPSYDIGKQFGLRTYQHPCINDINIRFQFFFIIYLKFSYFILSRFLSKFTSHNTAVPSCLSMFYGRFISLHFLSKLFSCHDISPSYCHLNFGLPGGLFPFRFSKKNSLYDSVLSYS